MDSSEERAELARAIDEAKLYAALNNTGRMLFLTDQQWRQLSPSAFQLLRKHNDRVLFEEHKRRTQPPCHKAR